MFLRGTQDDRERKRGIMGARNTALVSWLAQKAVAIRGNRGEHRVLVVPGNRPARGLHPCFLRQPHLRVLPGVCAAEAFDIAARDRPQLIIHDVDELDGGRIELCRRFKQAPETNRTPLIVIAAPEVRDDAEQTGADVVIDRPIVQSEYFDAVRRFVPLPRRRQDRYPINLRFSYIVRGRFRQAFSRDVSLYGAFLKTDAVLPEGAHIEVDFHLPGDGEEIRCGAVVRRSLPYRPQEQQLAGMAIEFEGIGESELRRLEQFIRRHQPHSFFAR